MATKKTNKGKAVAKRNVSSREADLILTKYYALKGYLYKLQEKGDLTATSRSLLKKAVSSLEKWRGNSLNLARMTGFSHD